ncbi:hypothetical protein SNEBB_008129 [Seison nebaliae]|nr:hypothetical protein SNEBB_008129 [Seison nebaliae]
MGLVDSRLMHEATKGIKVYNVDARGHKGRQGLLSISDGFVNFRAEPLTFRKREKKIDGEKSVVVLKKDGFKISWNLHNIRKYGSMENYFAIYTGRKSCTGVGIFIFLCCSRIDLMKKQKSMMLDKSFVQEIDRISTIDQQQQLEKCSLNSPFSHDDIVEDEENKEKYINQLFNILNPSQFSNIYNYSQPDYGIICSSQHTRTTTIDTEGDGIDLVNNIYNSNTENDTRSSFSSSSSMSSSSTFSTSTFIPIVLSQRYESFSSNASPMRSSSVEQNDDYLNNDVHVNKEFMKFVKQCNEPIDDVIAYAKPMKVKEAPIILSTYGRSKKDIIYTKIDKADLMSPEENNENLNVKEKESEEDDIVERNREIFTSIDTSRTAVIADKNPDD